MRLICPVCGALCSAEAWQNDATCRTFIDLLVKFPNDIRSLVLPYLGLFRTGKSGLTWSRAYRVIADLHTLTASGNVQWEGGETRPAPASLWAAAIDAVLVRRPKALQNHNYLRHVAWEMAAPIAARRERDIEAERRGKTDDGRRMTDERDPGSGLVLPHASGGNARPDPTELDGPLNDDERAEVQRALKEFTERFGR
jgi:hypothetical protein